MKEKIFKKGIKKRLLSVVLALTMVFTLMPLGSVVAQAVSTPLSGHEWVCCDTTKEHYVIVAKNSPSSKADKYYYESNEWHKSASDQTIPKKEFVDYDNVAVGGIYVLEDTKYVVCELPTYTVTFDANGHGTAPDPYTDIEYEYTITAPTEPTAEGYVFGGWYKEAACENEWDFDSDEVTDDITLYAKWTEAGPVVCGLCVNCGHAFDHGPDEGRDCMACDVSPEGPCFGSGAQNAKACVLEKGHAGNHHAHNSDAYGANEYRHWTKCTEDELNNGTEDFHDWSNCDGVCAICEYVCQHTGETSRICFVCDKILSGGSIAGCTVNGSKAHWKFDHWDEANSVYVGEFYSMNGNKEFNALAEYFDEGQTPDDLPGQVWWLGGDYLTACPGNHDGDSTGPQTYNFKDLAVGTVVNAGDTILRTGDDSGWLYFGSSYFSLAPMELAWPGYYMNDLESWTMGTDFPAIRSADAPDWYATSKSFVVTEVAVDGDWIYVRLAPNHTCTYTADGASITATCDRSCGAETAHTATMTLTPDGVNPTSVDGGTYFTGMTGLSLKVDDFKIYKTETEGAVTGGVELQGKMETGGYYYVSLTLGEATAVKAFIGRRVLTFAELEQGTVLSVGDAIARTSNMKGWLIFGDNFGFGLASSDNQEDVLNGAAYWVFGSELPAISSGTMPSWYASTTTFVVTTIISQDQSYTVYFEPNHTWSYEADGAVVTATCDRECGAEKAHVLTLTLSAEDTEMIVGSNETITYNKQETSGTLSTENLGTPTVWKYNGKNYEVYNEFISSTLGTTWNDAMAFVAKLNAAKYGGHDNWQLLNAVGGMGWQYYSDKVYDGYDPGSTIYLWEEACDANGAFFVNLRNGNWGTLEKSDSYYLLGFVILCGSDVASAGTKEEVAAWNEMFGTGMIPYIHYTGKAGSTTTLEDTTVEPLALGSYTASLTVGGVTATKDFSITKLSQTLSFAESAVSKTYGDTSFTITVTGADTTVTYSSGNTQVATVDATTGAVTILKAGTVTITATAAEDETHAEATASYTLTVGKATPTYTTPTGLTAYVGQTLADVTLPTGFTWANSTASVGSAGNNSFNATFTPTDTTNYNVVENISVTVAVAKNSQTLSFAESAVSKTYGDTSFTITVTGADTTVTYSSGNTQVATVDATTGAVTILKAGTVTITATAAEDETHAEATASVDFEITKANPTVTPPAATNPTYNGTAQALTDAGSTTAGTTIQYALGTNATTAPTEGWGNAIPTKTDAGTYYVWYKVEGNANYNDKAPACVTATVGKKPITVSGITAKDKIYDESTSAVLDFTNATFEGSKDDDALTITATGNFVDAYAGYNKVVNLTDPVLDGASVNNYTLGSIAPVNATINPKVTLQQGGEVKYTATNTGWNAGKATFNFEGQEIKDGDYNLVVEFGNKTVTQIVKYGKDITPPSDITPPTESVQAVVKTEGEKTPAVVVDGLDAVALAEKRDGHIVTVEMTVTSKDKAEIAEAEVNAIKEKVNGKNVEYLDVQIEKFVDSTHDSYIHNTSDLIKIVVPFQTSGRTGFKVVRYHDSAAQVLTELKDGDTATEGSFRVDTKAGTITIYAKQFSTYAVAYSYVSSGSYTTGHTVTSDLKSVTKVTIDGKVVDSRYYTVSSGTVYLTGEFMKTLANGKHTVKLYDGAKVATGIMTVSGNVAVISAATGDMGVALYAALSVSSILGMGWVGKKKRDDE